VLSIPAEEGRGPSLSVVVNSVNPNPACLKCPVTSSATAAFHGDAAAMEELTQGWTVQYRWEWDWGEGGGAVPTDIAFADDESDWTVWTDANVCAARGAFTAHGARTVKVTVQARLVKDDGTPMPDVLEATANVAITVVNLEDARNFRIVGYGDGSVTLAGDPSPSPNVAGYKYHIEPDKDTLYDVGNVTQYTVKGLENGVSYMFGLHTYDNQGNMTHTAYRRAPIPDVDTDGDGTPDKVEAANGLEPTDAGSAPNDPGYEDPPELAWWAAFSPQAMAGDYVTDPGDMYKILDLTVYENWSDTWLPVKTTCKPAIPSDAMLDFACMSAWAGADFMRGQRFLPGLHECFTMYGEIDSVSAECGGELLFPAGSKTSRNPWWEPWPATVQAWTYNGYMFGMNPYRDTYIDEWKAGSPLVHPAITRVRNSGIDWPGEVRLQEPTGLFTDYSILGDVPKARPSYSLKDNPLKKWEALWSTVVLKPIRTDLDIDVPPSVPNSGSSNRQHAPEIIGVPSTATEIELQLHGRCPAMERTITIHSSDPGVITFQSPNPAAVSSTPETVEWHTAANPVKIKIVSGGAAGGTAVVTAKVGNVATVADAGADAPLLKMDLFQAPGGQQPDGTAIPPYFVPLQGSSESMTVRSIDIQGWHAPGNGEWGKWYTHVSEADEEQPENLPILVNDDRDEGFGADNQDFTITESGPVPVSGDDDLAMVKLSCFRGEGVPAAGTVKLTVNPDPQANDPEIRILCKKQGAGNGYGTLSNYEIDLTNPVNSDLAALASTDGCVELYVEGLKPCADVTFTVSYELGGAVLAEDTLKMAVVDLEFIDEEADYALDSAGNGDTDSYFLRMHTGTGTEDYKNLDIHYRILPAGVPVTDVRVVAFEAESTNKASFGVLDHAPGETDGSGFKTGDSLGVQWSDVRGGAAGFPEIAFYRYQLQVQFPYGTVLRTPIRDDNPDMAGWQCPWKGAALYDLVFRHRPVVHVSSGEQVAAKGPIYPFAPNVVDHYRLRKGPAPAWPTEPDYADYGDFPAPDPLMYLSPDYEYPVLRTCMSKLGNVGATSLLAIDMQGFPNEDDNKHRALPCNLDSPVLCHYGIRHTSPGGSDYVFVQYWMYQTASYGPYYSGGAAGNGFTHDGDWEMVQICLRRRSSADPLDKRTWFSPHAAAASQHYYGQTLAWRRDKEGSGTAAGLSRVNQRYVQHGLEGWERIRVFIAENCHATYFIQGQIDANVFGNCGEQVQYNVPPAGRFDWVRGQNEAHYDLLALIPKVGRSILDWEGRWGDHHAAPGAQPPRGPKFRQGDPSMPLMGSPNGFHNACRKRVNADGDFDPGGTPDPETAL